MTVSTSGLSGIVVISLVIFLAVARGAKRKLVRLIARRARAVVVLAGVAMLGIGAYGLWVNWAFLSLYFG